MCDLDVKTEHTGNYNILFCYACLSSDRTLSSLGEYMDIFYKICIDSHTGFSSQICLCWECMTMLKKLKLFIQKIDNAQRILNFHYLSQQNSPPNSLSNLSVSKINTEDTLSVQHQEDGAKLTDKLAEVKQETYLSEGNEFENANDYTEENFENDNNIYLEDLRKETEGLFLKIDGIKEVYDWSAKEAKRSRQVHYRIIDPIVQGGKLSKVVSIKLNELSYWTEREKCGEFFKNSDYKCSKCVSVWADKKELLDHVENCHNESNGRYVCDTCSCRFATKTQLREHMARHYSALQCRVCGHTCCSPGNMAAHVLGHKRPVQCKHCDACFHNIRQFYKHYKAMHMVLLCDHCGKRCKSKHMLEKHMRRHLSTYECKACEKRFKSHMTLQRHNELKHVVARTEDAYCAPCGQQFSNALVYRRHLRTSAAHAHERSADRIKAKVSCPECGNMYSRKIYMTNHYRHVHMKQTKYYCGDCDRHFLNRTRYVDHRRYHHDGVKKEKNKLCTICGRGFSTNRTLTNHVRTHTGERPHECEQCGARFAQKTAMRSHVKYIHLKGRRRDQWP